MILQVSRQWGKTTTLQIQGKQIALFSKHLGTALQHLTVRPWMLALPKGRSLSNSKPFAISSSHPWASQVDLVIKNLLPKAREKRRGLDSLGQEDPPGGGHGNPLVFLPGESNGQRNLEGYSP